MLRGLSYHPPQEHKRVFPEIEDLLGQGKGIHASDGWSPGQNLSRLIECALALLKDEGFTIGDNPFPLGELLAQMSWKGKNPLLGKAIIKPQAS